MSGAARALVPKHCRFERAEKSAARIIGRRMTIFINKALGSALSK